MAKKEVVPVRHLTVYLLKKTVKKFTSALKDHQSLNKRQLKEGHAAEGTFYFRAVHESKPWWREYISPALKSQLPDLMNASNAAVLFIKVNERILCFCFGYGGSLIDEEAVVSRFGRRVTMNAVDPKRLRSLDLRSFESSAKLSRFELSKQDSVEAFGLDVKKDMLRAVTGAPLDTKFAEFVAGSTSLVIHSRVLVKDLDSKAIEILKYYDSNVYKNNFGWVDHVSVVEDKTIKKKLDDKLILAIKNEPDLVHLSPPELVNRERISGFTYVISSKVRSLGDGESKSDKPDLYLEDYLLELNDDSVSKMSLKTLKRHRVGAWLVDKDLPVKMWPVYSCLVYETTINGKTFCLLEGDYFEVNKKYADDVKKLISSIAIGSIALPPGNPGEHEGDWNSRVANSMSSEFALMDKKTVKPSASTSYIEVCDLLHKTRNFVHVKRKTESSTLSHLFNQGLVSAQFFATDDTYRVAARAKANESGVKFARLIPKSKPTPNDYTVSYAILSPHDANGKPRELPIFSQVSLSNTVRLLELMGYSTELYRVHQPKNPAKRKVKASKKKGKKTK